MKIAAAHPVNLVKQVSCSRARTKRRLRALPAKSARKISALALLNQDNDQNQKDANDDVHRNHKAEQEYALNNYFPEPRSTWPLKCHAGTGKFGAEEGT